MGDCAGPADGLTGGGVGELPLTVEALPVTAVICGRGHSGSGFAMSATAVAVYGVLIGACFGGTASLLAGAATSETADAATPTPTRADNLPSWYRRRPRGVRLVLSGNMVLLRMTPCARPEPPAPGRMPRHNGVQVGGRRQGSPLITGSALRRDFVPPQGLPHATSLSRGQNIFAAGLHPPIGERLPTPPAKLRRNQRSAFSVPAPNNGRLFGIIELSELTQSRRHAEGKPVGT